MKQRTLLLDADIVAYAVAARNEERYDWNGDGNISFKIDRPAAERDVHDSVEALKAHLKATHVVVCMSDPSNRYFRHDIYPQYKSNRKDVIKPIMLREMKDILAKSYETYRKPKLEADDCMGILATNKRLQQAKGYGEVIVVSEDKDMRTLPVKLYNPNKPDVGIIEINELDADRFHLWQTICGDTTDGYPGVKGVGPSSVYAEEIIFADRDELWDIVLDAFASKGQSEEDAIVQAQCARILRHQDWDYQRQRPRLWTPVTLYGSYES